MNTTGIGTLSDVLRAHWRLILAMTVAAGVVVAASSAFRAPSYSASAQVSLGSANPDIRLSLSEIEAERRRAETDEVVSEVVRALGLDSRRSLPDLSVVVEGTGNVLVFTVSSPKPPLVAKGANAWAAAFLDVRSSDLDSITSLEAELEARLKVAEAALADINEPITALEETLATSVEDEKAAVSKRISTLTDRVRIQAGALDIEISYLTTRLDALQAEAEVLASDNSRVIVSAETPNGSSRFSLIRDAVIGAAIGALLGLSTAVLLRTALRRIYSDHDVRDIGLIPIERLSFLAATHHMSIAVGSCELGEDASLVATDLARALTEHQQLVTLIDADLRHAPLDRLLTADGGTGLVELVSGEATDDEVTFPLTPAEDLLLIRRGSQPEHPVAVATNERVGLLIERVEARRVVLNVGCLTGVLDGAVLAARCHGTILVARRGLTSQASLVRALDQVVLAGGTIIGVVLVSERGQR